MNVCHVTSVHPPFDPRIFHRECLSLARADHDVTIVAPADFQERFEGGVRVLGVPAARRRRERVRVWRDIRRRLSELRPDVVHFHDPELLLVARLFRPARLIYDCHEYVAESLLTRPWIPRPVRTPLARLISVLEPLLARQADRIVIASPGQNARLSAARRPVTLLHNFPFLDPRRPSRHSDGATLIHVGAQARVRGSDDTIEAVSYVRPRVPQVRLLVVGPFNHAPYEQELRQLVRERGLEDVVDMVGEVSYTDVPNWLAKADVGLIPWRATVQYMHAVPSKVFDYMMAALPVVSSDMPEPRRLVTEAQCGLLVEPGNSKSLGEAIITLLENPEMSRTMGERGRQAYEERFNWSVEEPKLLQMYQGLGQ